MENKFDTQFLIEGHDLDEDAIHDRVCTGKINVFKNTEGSTVCNCDLGKLDPFPRYPDELPGFHIPYQGSSQGIHGNGF